MLPPTLDHPAPPILKPLQSAGIMPAGGQDGGSSSLNRFIASGLSGGCSRPDGTVGSAGHGATTGTGLVVTQAASEVASASVRVTETGFQFMLHLVGNGLVGLHGGRHGGRLFGESLCRDQPFSVPSGLYGGLTGLVAGMAVVPGAAQNGHDGRPGADQPPRQD